MRYKYGVSFNCNIWGKDGKVEVGYGEEGDISTDYVSNDLDKLIDKVTGKQGHGPIYIAKTDHEYVGCLCDVGDNVVAVIGEQERKDYFYVACVVFENPTTPNVV